MNNQQNAAKTSNYVASITDVTTLNLSNQSATVPTITLANQEHFGKAQRSARRIPDNIVTYEPVVLEFILSEDHREWIDCYNWIKDCVDKNDDEYEKTIEVTCYDAQQQFSHAYIYKNCLPSVLSGIRLVLNEDSTYLSSDITIEFESVAIRDKNGNVTEIGA